MFTPRYQCEQFGQFLKILATYFLTKVATVFIDFGMFLKHNFLRKTLAATFGQHFDKLGYFLFKHLVVLT